MMLARTFCAARSSPRSRFMSASAQPANRGVIKGVIFGTIELSTATVFKLCEKRLRFLHCHLLMLHADLASLPQTWTALSPCL